MSKVLKMARRGAFAFRALMAGSMPVRLRLYPDFALVLTDEPAGSVTRTEKGFVINHGQSEDGLSRDIHPDSVP